MFQVEAGDVVLDPMCGGGPIPLEGSLVHKSAMFLGDFKTIQLNNPRTIPIQNSTELLSIF